MLTLVSYIKLHWLLGTSSHRMPPQRGRCDLYGLESSLQGKFHDSEKWQNLGQKETMKYIGELKFSLILLTETIQWTLDQASSSCFGK